MKKMNLSAGIMAFLQMTVFAQADENLVKIFKYHKAAVVSVGFSPDGEYLVSGDEAKALIISNLNTYESEYEHLNNYFIPKALEVTQGNQIFLASGPDIKLVDFSNNSLAVFKGNSTYVWSIDYAPERNKITAGSYDYKIKVWDVSARKIDLVLEGHKKSTLPVAFSPDEKYIVSGSLDRTVKVWNAKTGELMKSLERHSDNIYDVEFHPSGKYFATASRDKTIRLWEFESGKVINTYTGHDKGILDIEFTPDGHHILSASMDGAIRLWQTKTAKMVYTFADHEGVVHCIALNKEGDLFASGGGDRKLILWKLSKKIFAEFAFYDEFEDEKSGSDLFNPKRKGEKKEEYNARLLEASEFEEQLADKYFKRYMENLRKTGAQ